MFKRYLKTYLVITLLTLGLVIAFNWFVNPYGIFKAPKISNFNTIKPEVTNHLRLAKAVAVEWIKPRSLILGCSTAETGLDPKHPGWKDTPVYNLALSGANLYEVMRYYQHDCAIRPPHLVVLVLDFFMFNAYLPKRSDFDEKLLLVNSDGSPNKQFDLNIFSTLASFDALTASYHTIKSQDELNAFLPNGQLEWNYRATSTREQGGYHNAFLKVESYIKSDLFPPPALQFSFIDPTTKISTWDYLRNIIALSRKNNTELIIVIAPSHARLLEAYLQLGLWPKFETWKQGLVNILNQDANDHPHQANYPLWDFSGYNHFTIEDIPHDKQAVTRWYWDDFHYKKILGDLILNRILNYQTEKVPSDFGIRLTTRNIANHLDKIRADQKKWRETHPLDIADLEKGFKNTA